MQFRKKRLENGEVLVSRLPTLGKVFLLFALLLPKQETGTGILELTPVDTVD